MTLALPPLLPRRHLRDACERTAEKEHLAPDLIEKDYYLTRLLWAFAQTASSSLLLKGGTLLSKVDLGFRRMSEDVDLVVPWERDRSLTYRSINASVLDGVAKTMRGFVGDVGFHFPNFTGTRWPQNQGALWDLEYESPYGTQGIVVEVSLGYVHRPPRRARLTQLLSENLAPGYTEAVCFALDRDEARAEKVHAAFARSVIRDYYDLRALLDAGFDFTSPAFLTLVDAKLQGSKSASFVELPPRFGITDGELVALERDIDRNLAAVVRRNEPRFDLLGTLDHFDRLWGKGEPRDT